MPHTATVVTPERYEQGLTYADFVAQAAVNQDQFSQFYDMARLTSDDVTFFKRAATLPSGPAKMLVIGEAWCPDVYRGVPVFVRIAQVSGMMLRVFLRDENPDIMDEFLSNEGRSRAIPVAVFYTRDLEYITHFTERPASAHAEIARVKADVHARWPNPDMQTLIRELGPRVRPLYPAWQVETVREIRELLSKALHVA